MAKAKKLSKKTKIKRPIKRATNPIASDSDLSKLIQKNLSSFVLGILIVFILLVSLVTYIGKTSKKIQPPLQLSQYIKNTPTKPAKTKQKNNIMVRKYKVELGDDLKKIALKFYGSEDNSVDIATANKLTNPDTIEVGQELIIPSVEPRNPSVGTITPEAASATSKNKNPRKDTVYITEQGDYLFLVAQKVYGDGNMWPKIASANNLGDNDFLSVGSKLQIPR